MIRDVVIRDVVIRQDLQESFMDRLSNFLDV